MYFKSFPKISYPVTISGVEQNILLTDITKNVRFLMKSLDSIRLYDTYAMKDGETPEIVSDFFYDTPNYHWLIMLVNNKYDYINDFPKTQRQLDKMISDKYGPTADNIAYWTKNGRVVDYDTPGASSITNRAHENILNESKRTLKIIPKEFVSVIIKDFLALLNG